MSKVAVETISLCMTYPSGERSIQALKDVNIRVEVGHFITISGPPGAGKTIRFLPFDERHRSVDWGLSI